MLWSLLKIFVFLAIATALAFGAAWVLETPGGVTVAFGGREFSVSPMGFLVALLVLVLVTLVVLRIIGLLVAVVRFLLGDETAISRYFARARERRGFDAFSEGMVALAAGDPRVATKKAAKAERLLQRPDITRLLSAQAAELSGDRTRAFGIYKDMLVHDRTRFVGVQGLMKAKLEEGDTETAMQLAKKAFALRPNNERVLRTLFDLQSKKEDWAGARETLNASMHARLLPRDIGTRRDAVLSLADARAALAEGNTARGNEAAIQANRLAPTLIPAAALAARAHAEAGARRKAARVLTTVWATTPHPDLAAAFAAIEPFETASARRTRFEALIAVNPNHSESRLLAAELALAAEDLPAARKALGDLAETEPTARSLALMAAMERAQGAPDAVVRGWLAKALTASRGPQWVCGKCSHVHAAWAPVCENCGAFDTLDWKTPRNDENATLASSAMLPLIVGPSAEGGSGPYRRGRVVEDAEIASAADQARAAGGS